MTRIRSAALFKTAVILSILLCLTVAIGGTAARADSEGAATVTASALYMRSEPSTSGSEVACLPKGTVVLVTTGSTDGWYKVWYQGKTGYMSKEYLSFSTAAQSSFGTGEVKGIDVNVRSGPGTGYTAVARANTGDKFSVTGVSGGWYKIDYKGSEAYISSTYMTVTYSSGQSSAPQPESSGDLGTGVITGDYVRLRSGPSTGSSVLGSYNTGAKMTVTGVSGDWYAVTCDGTAGYVYKQYLDLSGNTGSFTVEAMTDTPAYTTTAVNMRTGPSTSYAKQRVLAAGVSVTITGKSDNWYRVSYGGSTGYIRSDYLSTGSQQSGSSSSAGDKLVAEAKKYLGVPYVWGGMSPSGFDCSGFVYYVYRQCGYSITRVSTSQSRDGYAVSRSELQPGDIIIFNNSANTAIGHTGMYIGNNQFIHASSGSGKVIISSLSETYYNLRFYCARRVV